MAMSIGTDQDEDLNSTINTTPLVDVMLVMLIIFLITVPVVVTTVPVDLPEVSNIVTETKPENIVIVVDRDGQIYWNLQPVADTNELLQRAIAIAVLPEQPEVHIRADKETRFENIGRVIVTMQQASIRKLGFITNPEIGVVTR